MGKCGHSWVHAGHLEQILVVLGSASIVNHGALVAGELGSDRIDHLSAEVSEGTMFICTSMISGEISLTKLLLLLNSLHFSGES